MMVTAVFGHIEPFFILFYTERELRKVMVVDPITAYFLFPGGFAQVPVHFRKPVAEHGCLLGGNHERQDRNSCLEVAQDPLVQGASAPGSRNNYPADAVEVIRLIGLFIELKGGNKSPFFKLWKGSRIPKTKWISEVADALTGYLFQLAGGFIELGNPVIIRIFFYVMVIPGMRTDCVTLI